MRPTYIDHFAGSSGNANLIGINGLVVIWYIILVVAWCV